MDENFNLIKTVENAGQIYMLTVRMSRINTIRADQLTELAELFGAFTRRTS